jgi:hypothetical protein
MVDLFAVAILYMVDLFVMLNQSSNCVVLDAVFSQIAVVYLNLCY